MAKNPDTTPASKPAYPAKAEAASGAWPYSGETAQPAAAQRGQGPDRRSDRADPNARANLAADADRQRTDDKARTDDERRGQAKDRRAQRPASTERDVERAAGRGNAGRIPAARADAKPVTGEWQLLGDVELEEGHIYLGLVKGVQTEVQWHDGDLFTNNGGSFSLRNTDVTHIRERVEGPSELP